MPKHKTNRAAVEKMLGLTNEDLERMLGRPKTTPKSPKGAAKGTKPKVEAPKRVKKAPKRARKAHKSK